MHAKQPTRGQIEKSCTTEWLLHIFPPPISGYSFNVRVASQVSKNFTVSALSLKQITIFREENFSASSSLFFPVKGKDRSFES